MSERWEYGDVAAGEANEAAGEATGERARVERFPWPPPEDGSALGAFGETWKSATFEPTRFFRRLPREGGTGAALLYYLVLVVVVAGASLFWESLSLFTRGMEDSPLAAEMGLEAMSPLVVFLLTPVLLMGMLFVSAAITHGLLSLFDGGRHGFGTTVRAFCYAYSPGLFGIVPLLGGLVGSVWMIVLLIIGLREAHEADGWKPAVAVLLPFVLFLGLLVLAFVVMLAAGAAIMGA